MGEEEDMFSNSKTLGEAKQISGGIYRDVYISHASKSMPQLGKEPIIFGKYASRIEKFKQLIAQLYIMGFLTEEMSYEFMLKIMEYYRPKIKNHIQNTILTHEPSALISVLSLSEGVGVTHDNRIDFIHKCSKLKDIKDPNEIGNVCSPCGQLRKDAKAIGQGLEPKCPIFNLAYSFADFIIINPPNAFPFLSTNRYPPDWVDVYREKWFDMIKKMCEIYNRRMVQACEGLEDYENFIKMDKLGKKAFKLEMKLKKTALGYKREIIYGRRDERTLVDSSLYYMNRKDVL